MSVFDLWLPILLAGVGTHVASTVAWMFMPHHKPEWNKLPGDAEDKLLDFVGQNKVPANQYLFPFCDDPKEMSSEEYKAKEGRCRGMLILWPTPANMGKAIGLTLAFFFVAAFLIGYLASNARPAGDKFMNVFQFVFTAGVLVHCLGPFPGVFWFRKFFAMEVLDGVVYSLITAAIFAALWPAAA